jgi:hypothetical protein
VILTHSSFVTPPQSQALGRPQKPQRLSIARRSNLGKSVRRAGVGTDILHSLQRLIVDRVSLWARAGLTQARIHYGAHALAVLETKQERHTYRYTPLTAAMGILHVRE